MTKQVVWEGYHQHGGRVRAVFDGKNVYFEQAKTRDAMDQLIWYNAEEPPVAFLQLAAELMIKKGAPISGA